MDAGGVDALEGGADHLHGGGGVDLDGAVAEVDLGLAGGAGGDQVAAGPVADLERVRKDFFQWVK